MQGENFLMLMTIGQGRNFPLYDNECMKYVVYWRGKKTAKD